MSPEIPSDDGGLLRSWMAQRDEAAFRELCRRHAGVVAGACRRLGSPDPEEAAQAVFLVLARRAGGVDGRHLAGWLAGTARRIVAHQRRAAARRRRHEQEAAMEQERQRRESPADPAAARALIDAALASLSPARREAVIRFHLAGHPQAEIAAELGCSVDAVKTRIHEGIERMRAFLARHDVALGSAAVTTLLAAEAAGPEPALAAACTRAVIEPASAPSAATLCKAHLAMTFATTALATVASVALATGMAVMLGHGAISPPGAVATTPPAIAPAPAPAPAPLDPAANAALDWWRAIDALPGRSDPGWALAEDARSRLPDPAADALFGHDVVALDLFALGTEAPYCDWGIDLGREGASARLPHIAKMRSLFRLMLLRARWRAGGGDLPGATTDLLTCLRASRLAPGRHPGLIEVLSGDACESQALACAAQLAPQLGAEQRRRLVAGLAALPPALEVADAMGSEGEMVRCEIDRLLALPVAQRWPAVSAMTGNTGPGLPPADAFSDASLQACRAAYPMEIARWCDHLRRPLAERLRPLVPRFSNGDQAPKIFLGLMAPAIGTLARSDVRLAVARAQLDAALDVLERGDAALADHPDPLNGGPFAIARTAEGFKLSAPVAGYPSGAVLAVGAAPAPGTTIGAPVSF